MYNEREIKEIYRDAIKRNRKDLAVATYKRTWLLSHVAAKFGCGESTVRRAVPMAEHKRLIRIYL